MDLIYLDYAASTPIDPRVVSAMEPFHGAANPSSAHRAGREASDAVERARADVAALIGGSPGEIVFTSGATESDNLAIGGAIVAASGGHVVVTAAEHKAVLETTLAWCPDAAVVPVGSDGVVDPGRIEAAIRPDTVLVSVMAVNNETGAASAVQEIAEMCRDRGVLFHTDAAQAAGKVPLDAHAAGVDMLSMSAHKMYGPKGIGALWVRREVRPRLRPLMHGGGHERGTRSGTGNVAGCVGMGTAASLLIAEGDQDRAHTRQVRDCLLAAIRGAFPDAELNGAAGPRVDGIVNVRLPGVDAESLLLATPRVAASTGSACSSAVPTPSHVLLAMGLSYTAAQESLRLSFGRFTRTEHVVDAVDLLAASAVLLEDDAPKEVLT